MPIHITTGGPLNGQASLLETPKATFGAMIAAIADDVDDTNNEYLAQIQAAIFAAIRYVERENFYFNEARDVTFNTVSGKAAYDATDNKDIATLGGINAVYCQKAGQPARLLRSMTPEMWETAPNHTTSSGMPHAYSYFAQNLRLYPTPDGDYLIRLSVAPKRLDTITSTDEVHPWFEEAFDLVKARAKYELYKNILQDEMQATISLHDFTEQLHALRAETSRRNRGTIAATLF